MKAADYGTQTNAAAAFVVTNSICQGQQVPILWPMLFATGHLVAFAHTSFKWANRASNNAGVTVIVIGLRSITNGKATLFDGEIARTVASVGVYLAPDSITIVSKSNVQISGLPQMVSGNKATDEGNFILSKAEYDQILTQFPAASDFLRKLESAMEFIRGQSKWCIWLEDADIEKVALIFPIAERIERVRKIRNASRGTQARNEATRLTVLWRPLIRRNDPA